MAGVNIIPRDYVDLEFWQKLPHKFNTKKVIEGSKRGERQQHEGQQQQQQLQKHQGQQQQQRDGRLQPQQKGQKRPNSIPAQNANAQLPVSCFLLL